MRCWLAKDLAFASSEALPSRKVREGVLGILPAEVRARELSQLLFGVSSWRRVRLHPLLMNNMLEDVRGMAERLCGLVRVWCAQHIGERSGQWLADGGASMGRPCQCCQTRFSGSVTLGAWAGRWLSGVVAMMG